MSRDGKHVLSHVGIYFLARGLPGIIAFLAIPLFTRLLEPAEYGRYALVLATASLINALLFQWARLSLVRFLPAFRDEPAKLKSTLLTSTLVLIGVLGLIGAAMYVLPLPQSWRDVIIPCWILLAVQACFELCCEYARASLRPWHYMGLQIARSSAAILLGVGLVWMGFGWWGPLLGLAAGMALGIGYAARSDWSDVRPSIDRETLIKVCQYGLPLSMTVALTVVISSSDRFIIAWFHGEDAAGLYSVAVDFTSQTLTLLLMVINMAMFPMAVRAFEAHGTEAAQRQMGMNASLLMAVGVPCVVGMTVLAPGIAHSFIGQSYREAAISIMPLIVLGTFLAGFKAYHFDAAFQFAHRTIYQVWIVLFAAIVNVLLNLVAVPRWGIHGAAGASLLAYIVSIALTAWLGRRHFVLPFPLMTCIQTVIASALMGAALYPFRGSLHPLSLAAQILAGVAVYALLLIGGFNFMGFRDALLRKFARHAPAEMSSGGSLAEAQ